MEDNHSALYSSLAQSPYSLIPQNLNHSIMNANGSGNYYYKSYRTNNSIIDIDTRIKNVDSISHYNDTSNILKNNQSKSKETLLENLNKLMGESTQEDKSNEVESKTKIEKRINSTEYELQTAEFKRVKNSAYDLSKQILSDHFMKSSILNAQSHSSSISPNISKNDAHKDIEINGDNLKCMDSSKVNKSPSRANMAFHHEKRLLNSDNEENDDQEDDIYEHFKEKKKYSQNLLSNKLKLQKKKVKKCYNKLCLTDPNDSSLWSKNKINKVSICKTCETAYKNKQYCHFCKQIYLDPEVNAVADDKAWIECEDCKCWTHIECEQNQGLKNISIYLKEVEVKYICPNCRLKLSKNQNLIRKKNIIKNDNALFSRLDKSKKSKNFLTKTNSHSRNKLYFDDDNYNYGYIYDYENNHKNENPLKKLRKIDNGSKKDYTVCTIETNTIKSTIEPNNIHQQSFNDCTNNINQINKDDNIKRRIDNFINKANICKRRIESKSMVMMTHEDDYLTIDNLMNQYGNKKLQLNEQEIKQDIILLRQISKSTNVSLSNSHEKSPDEESNHDSPLQKNQSNLITDIEAKSSCDEDSGLNMLYRNINNIKESNLKSKTSSNNNKCLLELLKKQHSAPNITKEINTNNYNAVCKVAASDITVNGIYSSNINNTNSNINQNSNTERQLRSRKKLN